MIITVNTASGIPPYEQIRAQFVRMIAAQVLAPGDRLPTIAQLAADLALANGTVARAYRELEREGLIESSRRRGTFVAPNNPGLKAHHTAEEFDRAVEQFALACQQLGIPAKQAIRSVTHALQMGPASNNNPQR